MTVVLIEFGSLMGTKSILDCEFVEVELLGQPRKLAMLWAAEIDPHHRCRVCIEVMPHVTDGKPFSHELSVEIRARAGDW